MAVRLSPSRWLTASCSDPNTSDPPVWRRDQRGPDRQTARLAPCLSCQNRQAANRNAQEYPSFRPFCLSLCALFLSEVVFLLCYPSVAHPLCKLRPLICKCYRTWISKCVCVGGVVLTSTGKDTSTLSCSILLYFIFLTLCDRSGGWNVWRWGWEEHEWRRETTLRSGQTVNPRDHRTLEQGSVIHGLWVTSLRGIGPIPAWRYCWCCCQQPCIKLFCQSRAPKISRIFPLNGNFQRYISACIQSRAKAILRWMTLESTDLTW